MSQYEYENQALADFVMQKYFYDDFSINTPRDKKMRNIELIVSPRCNLGCKYCYIHRHRKEIFSEDCFNEEKTISNLKLFLKWMRKQEFNPSIEIFSGELLGQEVGYKVLETIYEHFKDQEEIYRPREIVIPTNFTFICKEKVTARVEEIRNKLNSIGITLGLSASFDGKYMEENRPYLHDLDVDLGGGVRDDAYYERAFKYVEHIKGGFHPMVYSKNIKAWPKNFDWFQEQFEKYNLPWENIYLLHVRNEEWNKEQIQDLCTFIEHIFAFAWEKVEHNPAQLVNWILKANGFNMLGQPYTSCGRGLTCGIQGQFTLRLSDMMMYPCHRLGYKDFYYGQYVVDEDENLHFVSKNVELMIATYATHRRALPMCAQCPINQLCSGTCLGAQYESNSNMLAPIPSVCAVAYAMILTNMKCLKKYHAYDLMMEQMHRDKIEQFQYLEEYVDVFRN